MSSPKHYQSALPFWEDSITQRQAGRGRGSVTSLPYPGGPQEKSDKDLCVRGLPSLICMFKVNNILEHNILDLDRILNVILSNHFAPMQCPLKHLWQVGNLLLTPLATKYIHSHATSLRLSQNQLPIASTHWSWFCLWDRVPHKSHFPLICQVFKQVCEHRKKDIHSIHVGPRHQYNSLGY